MSKSVQSLSIYATLNQISRVALSLSSTRKKQVLTKLWRMNFIHNVDTLFVAYFYINTASFRAEKMSNWMGKLTPVLQDRVSRFPGVRFEGDTVRGSNFDRRNPKMGVLLPSTEATPCGHNLE
jgi:hypothetical protein